LADIFSKKKRSKIMASISGIETKPEIAVRSFLFKKGFRFRKNIKTLPGKPDIVLTKYKTVIFIHGCFWHGHINCAKSVLPTSNIEFWKNKIQKNIDRDKIVLSDLKKLDWKAITIWQCEIKNKKLFEETMQNVIKILLENLNVLNNKAK